MTTDSTVRRAAAVGGRLLTTTCTTPSRHFSLPSAWAAARRCWLGTPAKSTANPPRCARLMQGVHDGLRRYQKLCYVNSK